MPERLGAGRRHSYVPGLGQIATAPCRRQRDSQAVGGGKSGTVDVTVVKTADIQTVGDGNNDTHSG